MTFWVKFNMPIHTTDFKDILSGFQQSVVATCSEISTYLDAIEDCDDWAFVIKSQAFMETRISAALVMRLGEDAIQSSLSRIPLADKEIGKLTLTKDLNLLTDEQRTFVRKIAELRNKLAHDFGYVRFSFDEHIRGMDPSQKKSWMACVTWPWNATKRQVISNKWQVRAIIMYSVCKLVRLMELHVSENCAVKGFDKAELKFCREYDRQVFYSSED